MISVTRNGHVHVTSNVTPWEDILNQNQIKLSVLCRMKAQKGLLNTSAYLDLNKMLSSASTGAKEII